MKQTLAAAAALLALSSAQAQVVAERDRVSDVIRVGLPAAAAALSFYKDDTDGLKQLALSLALSAGSTELLKRGVNAKRPDGTGYSFPSGHVSMAFTAAGYVHERYSLQWALPFYGLATLAAYERVNKHHHFTRDVIGGAVVGMLSAWAFTGHYTAPRSHASIGYWDHTVTVSYATTW